MWLSIGSSLIVAIILTLRFVRLFVVPEGHAGLLYRNGRLIRTFDAGLHWAAGWRIALEAVDTRLQQLDVLGQELLTKDQITVKISLHVEQRVKDAVAASREASSWRQKAYSALQLALRDAVAKRTFDETLQQRSPIADETRARAAVEMGAIGIEIVQVAIRDVMLSAELRRAFAARLRFREEGKAALEKARAETAALRSLANAARMLKDNPDLLNLRWLQSIETVAAASGNTLVLGPPTELTTCADRQTGADT